MKGSATVVVLLVLLAVCESRSNEFDQYSKESFKDHVVRRRHLTPLGSFLHNAASKLLNPIRNHMQTGSSAESQSFSIGGSILGLSGSISTSRSKANSVGGAGSVSAGSSAQSSGFGGNGFSNSNAGSSAQVDSLGENGGASAQSSGSSNVYGQQGFSNSQSSSQASSKFDGGQYVQQQQPIGFTQPVGSYQGFGGAPVKGGLGETKVIGYEITPIVVPVRSLPTSNSFSNSQASSASKSVTNNFNNGLGGSGLISVPLSQPGIAVPVNQPTIAVPVNQPGIAVPVNQPGIAVPVNQPGIVVQQPVLGQQGYYQTNYQQKQPFLGSTGGTGSVNKVYGQNVGSFGGGLSNSQSQSSSQSSSGNSGVGGNLIIGIKTPETLYNTGGLGTSQGIGSTGYNTQNAGSNSIGLGNNGAAIQGNLGSGSSSKTESQASSSGSFGSGVESDLDTAIKDVFGTNGEEYGSISGSKSSSQNYSEGLTKTGTKSSSQASSSAGSLGSSHGHSSSKSQAYSSATSTRSNSDYLIFT